LSISSVLDRASVRWTLLILGGVLPTALAVIAIFTLG
jgi:hypothetical protein